MDTEEQFIPNRGFTSEKAREVLGYVLVFLITFFVLQLFIEFANIPSSSMEPTLMKGKKYLFEQVSYIFSDPKCGDIIIFDSEGVVYAKRIIGTPGDVIDFADGKVFINGQELEEPYAYGETYTYYEDHFEVPEGMYFFLGDNRENSNDSRFWPNPYITKAQILGRVLKF